MVQESIRNLVEQIRDEASVLLSGLEHSETEVVSRLNIIGENAAHAYNIVSAQTHAREAATGLAGIQLAIPFTQSEANQQTGNSQPE